MSPRHFSKQMYNPYFQTDHYKNESNELRIQSKIEKIFFHNPLFEFLKKVFIRKGSK